MYAGICYSWFWNTAQEGQVAIIHVNASQNILDNRPQKMIQTT